MESNSSKKEDIISFIVMIFFVACLISLGICLANILTWKIQNENTKDIIKDIQKVVGEDTNNKKKSKEENLYWNFVNMDLKNIDFSKLKRLNSQTVGWVKVEGTYINYPFVQTTDNEYYLSHTYNFTKNIAGWVFMDYRNNSQDFDQNTILYGHAVKTGVMFGTLKNVLTSSWQNKESNHYITTVNENELKRWQIFSVYTIPETSDYLVTNFSSENEFENFANMLKNRSVYNFNTDINNNDKIITLSSCYNNDGIRVVVHAKLVKTEKRD